MRPSGITPINSPIGQQQSINIFQDQGTNLLNHVTTYPEKTKQQRRARYPKSQESLSYSLNQHMRQFYFNLISF
jgi:hypothetical protein